MEAQTQQAINALDTLVKQNGQLLATQQAPQLEAELQAGKQSLADAITRKGVETTADTPLAQMAANIHAIQQQHITLTGQDTYGKAIYSSFMYDLFQAAYEIKNKYGNDYKGFIVAQYYKGYETIELQGADAYLTSDGRFYDGSTIHTWNDDSTYADRYVAYLYHNDDFSFSSAKDGLCPRTMLVVGQCASVSVDYNRLTNLYVLGTLGTFSCGVSGTPGATWAQTQVIPIRKMESGYVFYFATNMTFILFDELEELNDGTLYYSGNNSVNQLISVRLPKLRKLNGNIIYLQNSNQWCGFLIDIYLPALQTISGGQIINGGSFDALTKLDLPALQTISGGQIINGGSFDALTKLELPALQTINGNGVSIVSTFSALREMSFPSLQTINRGVILGLWHCNPDTWELLSFPAIELMTVKVLSSSYGDSYYPKRIYIGYTINDRTQGISLQPNDTSTLRMDVKDVELKEGFCKPLNVASLGGLEHDNIVEHILKRLGDNTGQDTLTITLGATNLAKLTDEEKAIATNKNFTLA